jgi:murein peptide amidase A
VGRGIPALRTSLTVAVACAAAFAAVAAAGARGAAPPDSVGHRTVVLGRSIEGRAISATETGDFDSPHKTLVVGCIHGNECAGIAVTDRLARTPAPAETVIWIIRNLNPDGDAVQTRGNAHGVDLNRNFPWHWRPLGGLYNSGPRPLSEPETRLAYRLIARVRPSVSIWFHQHLDLVDDSTGSRPIERSFARTAGLRLAPLRREPGSVVTWQSHCFPRGSAFVVELPSGALAPTATARLVRAVHVAAVRAPRPPTRSAVCKAGG